MDFFYLFSVETDLDNEPTSKLHKNIGFVEVKQWDTNDEVRKAK